MTLAKHELRPLTLSCLLFAFTLPLPIFFNNVAIGIMAVTWFLESSVSQKWNTFKKCQAGYWIFILYGCYVISLIYSSNANEGLSRLETKLSLLALPFLIFSSQIDKDQIQSILVFFTYSVISICMVLVAIASVKYFHSGDSNLFFYHELTRPLNLHAIYLANYLTVGILVLIFIDPLKNKIAIKIGLLVLSVILIVMLSALSVTVYLLALSTLGASVLMTRMMSLRMTIITASALIAFILTAVLLTPRTRDKIMQINKLDYKMSDPDYAWNTITLRLALWECTLPVIKENPFLGVGVGDEDQALQDSYAKFDFREGVRCNYNEHNQYLATSVATGLIGLLSLICMLLFPIYGAFKVNDWLFFLFLLLMGISFFTENFLSLQKGVVFFSFFYGLLIKRQVIASSNLNP